MSEDDTVDERPRKKRGRPKKEEAVAEAPVEAAPPPPAPKPAPTPKPAPVAAKTPTSFIVAKAKSYVMRGHMIHIAEGTRVTARTHDLDALLEQGVELKPED